MESFKSNDQSDNYDLNKMGVKYNLDVDEKYRTEPKDNLGGGGDKADNTRRK